MFIVFAFFLIGLGSSNDWEGGGTLAKFVLIPICLVLGLLLFKLAAPLFSSPQSTRSKASAEVRTRNKISNNKYRMGNDLPTSYALTVLGLILLFISISREDTQMGMISVAVFFFSFRMRGRLQTEQNIAKRIGAKTFKNDIEDTVVGAAELAGNTAKFVYDLGVSGFQKLVSGGSQNTTDENLSNTIKQSNNDQKQGGSSSMSFEQTGAIILLNQLGWPEQDLVGLGPIGAARELLLNTWQVFSLDSSQQGVTNTRILIITAMKSLAWALNTVSETEFMSGGRSLDQDDALMWYGVCAGLLVPPSEGQLDLGNISRPRVLSKIPDVMALAVAHDNYALKGDPQRAGRCAHELYEIMRIRSDADADKYFALAEISFKQLSFSDRSEALAKSKTQESRQSSPFFHRAFGPDGSTSVSGSIEYATMAAATYLASIEYATMAAATYLASMNTSPGNSNESAANWFQLGQKVRFVNSGDLSGETGVVVSYIGGTEVVIKMDRGPDADGIEHVFTHWGALERI